MKNIYDKKFTVARLKCLAKIAMMEEVQNPQPLLQKKVEELMKILIEVPYELSIYISNREKILKLIEEVEELRMLDIIYKELKLYERKGYLHRIHEEEGLTEKEIRWEQQAESMIRKLEEKVKEWESEGKYKMRSGILNIYDIKSTYISNIENEDVFRDVLEEEEEEDIKILLKTFEELNE